ncbi:DoxX family protein [Amylibacter sp. SFDW26]|uniref:DoxX family protein n=1 Tax=Amylibacter sp. SFDW26 TaxID=2652722 RepID=UPI00126167B2|nr:DoxX family protein [Amylibacter sp. SFDW26]KAB7615949.1 DoxX family protein [Amylibacter sp. SFDW26]
MTQRSTHSVETQTLWEKISNSGSTQLTNKDADLIALILRIGLGAVFIIGGWWKLSRAIDPLRADALVNKYLAPDGYINAFFQDYLFSNGILSPWMFMTTLSAFELFAGIALVSGLFVRPLAIVFGLLMWSFVAALPVLTTPGENIENSTFLTPAMIVQIRDIGLSGFCFVLALMGSGTYSFDRSVMSRGAPANLPNLVLSRFTIRISIAVVLLAGGAFYGLDHVKSWTNFPIILTILGIVLILGHGVRIAASICCVVIIFYCINKFSLDKTLWDNLNAIKREIAYLAAVAVLIRYSGGQVFQFVNILQRPRELFFGKLRETDKP